VKIHSIEAPANLSAFRLRPVHTHGRPQSSREDGEGDFGADVRAQRSRV
jgi:hypothetical protein